MGFGKRPISGDFYNQPRNEGGWASSAPDLCLVKTGLEGAKREARTSGSAFGRHNPVLAVGLSRTGSGHDHRGLQEVWKGRRLDCGDASMALLAAFIKDTNPRCTPLAITSELAYVVCSAAIGNQTVDLGTALVGSGYAFAALDNRGLPANPAYAVAEQRARAARAGLWQFADVQHPALILGPAGSQGKARK
jgi:hypothetical protein